MAKILIIAGILLILAGVIVHFLPRLPWLGKLPGAIVGDKGNFKFYSLIPISILISLVSSIILFLITNASRWLA